MTIKELADQIGVSKTTISNTIRELGITPSLKEGHKQTLDLSDDEVKSIKDYLLTPQSSKDTTTQIANATTKETTETANATAETTQSTAETAQEQEKAEKDNTLLLIEMLREELKTKNDQLAIKDKQIQDLSDRLSEANANLSEALKATRGQQYITAQDKAAQMLEADLRRSDPIVPDQEVKETKTEEPKEQPAKKSWLAKLLGL